MSKNKVAFIISHPIQYYVPILSGLTERGNIDLKVFYTWGKESISKFDPGFNRVVEWDTPLLDGYSYEFETNISPDPGTHHFKGIDNPNLIQNILQYNPDKIVVFGWSFKSHLEVLKFFKGKKPIYFRGDSNLLTQQSLIKKMIRKIYLTYIYRFIDFALYVGTNNKDYYKWLGLKDSQLLFAPHAIDDKRFVDTTSEFEIQAKKIKLELGIPDNHVVFLYTGKFEYRKDLHTLIKAKLLLKDSNCSLILVGNGPDENELKEMSKADKNIHFVNFMNQSQMPIVYRSADVFVLPSISETWGLGINEAMNCGVAIIASNLVGSAIDLVKNNGYIFRAKDISDLADKMNSMILNKSMLEEFKRNSIEEIKYWSIERLVVNFENALK